MALSHTTIRFKAQPHSWSLPRRASIVSAFMGGFRLPSVGYAADSLVATVDGVRRRGQSQMERMGIPG